MKSIFYIGATLMIGASIYGFVDYKNTNRNKEFRSMYKSEEARELRVKENEQVIAPVESTEPAPLFKKEASEPVEVEVKAASLASDKKIIAKYKKATKKKLNFKKFSRAPLREEIEVSAIRPASLPKAEKIKEQ